jgi:hypothetical protein
MGVAQVLLKAQGARTRSGYRLPLRMGRRRRRGRLLRRLLWGVGLLFGAFVAVALLWGVLRALSEDR